MNEENIKEIKTITGYKRGIKTPILGSIIYTDGEVINSIKESKTVDGIKINENLSSDIVNNLEINSIKLKNASYIIHVYYKNNVLEKVNLMGWYHQIVGVNLDLINKKSKRTLKKTKKVLDLIKEKDFVRELSILESNKSSIIYENNENIFVERTCKTK